MKKILSFVLVILCFMSVIKPCFAAPDSVILINGVEAPIEPSMGSVKNISARTFVPVRFVLEYFGFNVTGEDTDQIVMGRNSQGDMFLMQVSNPVLSVKHADGGFETIKMDVSPILFAEEGRTYIPVRFLAQAIGYKVGYDEATGTVMLDK